jgi:hypothetical protein
MSKDGDKIIFACIEFVLGIFLNVGVIAFIISLKLSIAYNAIIFVGLGIGDIIEIYRFIKGIFN